MRIYLDGNIVVVDYEFEQVNACDLVKTDGMTRLVFENVVVSSNNVQIPEEVMQVKRANLRKEINEYEHGIEAAFMKSPAFNLKYGEALSKRFKPEYDWKQKLAIKILHWSKLIDKEV